MCWLVYFTGAHSVYSTIYTQTQYTISWCTLCTPYPSLPFRNAFILFLCDYFHIGVEIPNHTVCQEVLAFALSALFSRFQHQPLLERILGFYRGSCSDTGSINHKKPIGVEQLCCRQFLDPTIQPFPFKRCLAEVLEILCFLFAMEVRKNAVHSPLGLMKQGGYQNTSDSLLPLHELLPYCSSFLHQQIISLTLRSY